MMPGVLIEGRASLIVLRLRKPNSLIMRGHLLRINHLTDCVGAFVNATLLEETISSVGIIYPHRKTAKRTFLLLHYSRSLSSSCSVS